jgi:hypothetical protein
MVMALFSACDRQLVRADTRASSGARTAAFLDEIPAAYKPIDTVMEDAKTSCRSTMSCARS